MICCHFGCERAVPEAAEYQRLRLCSLDMAYGCLAYCERCGENWPEHGPGGRGCATWLQEDHEPPAVQLRRLRDDGGRMTVDGIALRPITPAQYQHAQRALPARPDAPGHRWVQVYALADPTHPIATCWVATYRQRAMHVSTFDGWECLNEVREEGQP